MEARWDRRHSSVTATGPQSSTRPANGCGAMPSGSRSAVIAIREEATAGGTQADGNRAARHHGRHRLAYLAQRFSNMRRLAPRLTGELGPRRQTVYVTSAEGRSVRFVFPAARPGRISKHRQVPARPCSQASWSYLDCHGCPTACASAGSLVSCLIEDLIQVDSVRWLATFSDAAAHRLSTHQHDRADERRGGGLGCAAARLLPLQTAGPHSVLPGIAAPHREVWLNVHSDLQVAPALRAAILPHEHSETGSGMHVNLPTASAGAAHGGWQKCVVLCPTRRKLCPFPSRAAFAQPEGLAHKRGTT